MLDAGFQLDLHDKFYVFRASISRNLIFVTRLDQRTFKFGHGILNIYRNNVLDGNGFECHGLYKLSLDPIFAQTLMTLHTTQEINVGILTLKGRKLVRTH